MKKVVLGSLIAIATSQAGGCIINNNTNTDVAHVTVGWTLRTSLTRAITTCPPGYDTAALYTQQVDATGRAIGQPIIDLFNCADGLGRTAALPPAYYEEWMEIANHTNTSQFARSKSNLEEAPALLIDLTTSDLTYNTEVLVDGGYFRFGWNLVGETSGQPLSCAAAGAAGGVDALSTEVGTSLGVSDTFHTCSNLEGITGGLPSAAYTISIAALNSAGQSVGTAPTLTNKVIQPVSALVPVTDLGVINVPIAGL